MTTTSFTKLFGKAIAQRDGLHCHYCMIRLSIGYHEWSDAMIDFQWFREAASDEQYNAKYPNGLTSDIVDFAEVDHVIPRCKGGSDSLDNLVLSCSRCNCYKGAKLISEWQPKRIHRYAQ